MGRTGFVIQILHKKIIITSDCDRDLQNLNYGKNGYVYKSNNIKFIKNFQK